MVESLAKEGKACVLINCITVFSQFVCVFAVNVESGQSSVGPLQSFRWGRGRQMYLHSSGQVKSCLKTEPLLLSPLAGAHPLPCLLGPHPCPLHPTYTGLPAAPQPHPPFQLWSCAWTLSLHTFCPLNPLGPSQLEVSSPLCLPALPLHGAASPRAPEGLSSALFSLWHMHTGFAVNFACAVVFGFPETRAGFSSPPFSPWVLTHRHD